MAKAKKRVKKSAAEQWVDKQLRLLRDAQTLDFGPLAARARENLETVRRGIGAFCEQSKRGAFLWAREVAAGNPENPDAFLADLAQYSLEDLRNAARAFLEFETRREVGGATDALRYKPEYLGRYFSTPDRPEFAGYTHWLAQFRNLHHGERFLRQPIIVAEMLAHRVAEPETATKFWTLVFTEGAIDGSHPARELAHWLRYQAPLKGQNWKKPSPVMVRRKTKAAWERFRLL